jgi:hypothetical protein
MISKAGCIAMGIHASDQLAAGAHQLVTARETDSYAFKAGMTAAEVMGASRATGQVVGLAAEFAVPLSTASFYNAFRVSSVRAGRMTLVVSEQPMHAPNNSVGGHSLKRHVAKTLEYLQRRLRKQRNLQVVSTFDSIELAEWAVSRVLAVNKLKIQIYSKLPFLLKGRKIAFTMDLKRSVGWGIKREAPDVSIAMTKVKVVVQYEEFNYMSSYIVTSFPIP